MTTQLVTLRNDFHGTQCMLRCEVLSHVHGEVTIRPNISQIKRAQKQLCGISGCTCGTAAGTRGIQLHGDKYLIVDTSALYARKESAHAD